MLPVTKLSSIETNTYTNQMETPHHSEKETEIIDLVALDNEDDDAEVMESTPLPECFKTNDIEDFPPAVQDQLRLELMTKTKLTHLYDKQQSDVVVREGEYQITALYFNNDDRKNISSARRLKLYYCIEWFIERKECKAKMERCPYNLFWYEPITAFTTDIGGKDGKPGIDRVFLAFRPLLDLDCKPTVYELVYAMYTMCDNPIYPIVVYNTITDQIELWRGGSGNIFLIISSKTVLSI